MTQIKKTLSIAGIIALVTAPAMAEIASTQYVQNTLSSITGALDAKLSNNATGQNAIAIGNASADGEYSLAINGTTSAFQAIAIGGGGDGSAALGEGAVALGALATTYSDYSTALGEEAYIGENAAAATAIGTAAYVSIGADYATAIGSYASVGDGASNAIQLGRGDNNIAGTFQVFNTMLLNTDGIVPATALAPEIPETCSASVGQKCALVVTWDGTKYSQSWEVIRSTSSGQ